MQARKLLILGAAAAAIAPIATPAAEAASVQITPKKATYKRGTKTAFTLRLDHVGACSIRVGLYTLRFPGDGYDSVRVLVPKKLIAGSRRAVPVVLSCAGASATAKVTVPKKSIKRGERPRAAPLTLDSWVRHVPTPPEAQAQANASWAQYGGQYMAGFHTGLSLGQCTDWAASKRPDVIQRSWIAGETARLLGQPALPVATDAWTWPAAARAAGMTVTDRPVTGALVVWQPGSEGAGAPAGHVGYVEAVTADAARFTTSEMNVNGVGQMGYRTLSTAPVAGREFILP